MGGDAVRVVSLGSWCGVKTALKNLGLEGQALPFDWIRSSMPSLLHNLQSNFDGFLAWECVQESPYKEHATPHGRIYITADHSFWHDNLEDIEEREKLRRRITRFLELGQSHSGPLLFVRSASTTLELQHVETLLSLLVGLFGYDKVYVLLLIDAQHMCRFFCFKQQPNLAVCTIDLVKGATGQRYATKYHEAIVAALTYVQTARRPEGHYILDSVCELVRARHLIRHVSLGEDLTVPWCHDPVMPPPLVLKWAADDVLTKEIVDEQVRQHRAFIDTEPSVVVYPM